MELKNRDANNITIEAASSKKKLPHQRRSFIFFIFFLGLVNMVVVNKLELGLRAPGENFLTRRKDSHRIKTCFPLHKSLPLMSKMSLPFIL